MKPTHVLAGAFLVASLGVVTRSQTPPPAPPVRIALIDMQAAVAGTREGRQAELDLQSKFEPLRAALMKKEKDLQTLQEQLQKGGTTMNEETRIRLERQLEAGNRAAKHGTEDLNAEYAGDQAVAAHELEKKMAAEVEKFAAESGYAAVFDVGAQTNQLVWAPPASSITALMIKRYDQANPGVAR
jgi:Skp family chaperone for outer membrane proteins